MAKRQRQPIRPRGRRPAGNGARPASAAPEPKAAPDIEAAEDFVPRAGGLTPQEETRAAEIEAQIVERERAATATVSASRRSRTRGREVTFDAAVPLSVRASHEYAYVARDIRRIGLTAGLMVSVLAILYILINVMGVITV